MWLMNLDCMKILMKKKSKMKKKNPLIQYLAKLISTDKIKLKFELPLRRHHDNCCVLAYSSIRYIQMETKIEFISLFNLILIRTHSNVYSFTHSTLHAILKFHLKKNNRGQSIISRKFAYTWCWLRYQTRLIV